MLVCHLVNTPPASPKVVSLARLMASSSVSNTSTAATEPKISSLTAFMSSLVVMVLVVVLVVALMGVGRSLVPAVGEHGGAEVPAPGTLPLHLHPPPPAGQGGALRHRRLHVPQHLASRRRGGRDEEEEA